MKDFPLCHHFIWNKFLNGASVKMVFTMTSSRTFDGALKDQEWGEERRVSLSNTFPKSGMPKAEVTARTCLLKCNESSYGRQEMGGPVGGALTALSSQKPYRKNSMVTWELYGYNSPSPGRLPPPMKSSIFVPAKTSTWLAIATRSGV